MERGTLAPRRTAVQRFQLQAHTSLERVAVDADTGIIVFLNDRREVFAQQFTYPSARKLPFEDTSTINSVCLFENFIAVCANDGFCRVEEIHSLERQYKVESKYPWPVDCCMMANPPLLGIMYVDYWKRKSRVIIVDRISRRTVFNWDFNSVLASIDFSPDSSLMFVTEVGTQIQHGVNSYLKMHAADTGILRGFLEISTFNGTLSLFKVCCSANAEIVAIMDACSLRVWYIRQAGMPVYNLPGYSASNTSSSHPHSVLGACAISQDGRLVVAAAMGNSFGIWNTQTRTQIATLGGHTATPLACAISSDGNTVLTVARDNTVIKWRLKPGARTPSALEEAFRSVLKDADVLNEEFLLKNLCPANVKSACDLLAGHNLVLLAIRSGVITRENIETFGGSSWYLEDNLYLPASKLLSENALVIDSIFQHADNLGIIKNGYALKIAREIRADLGRDVAGMTKIMENFAERIGDLEQRVDRMEKQTAELEKSLGDIRLALAKISMNQEQLHDNVYILSKSLSQLRKSIRKKDKRKKYAMVARCFLSLIPIVGMSIGDAACTVMSLLMNFGGSDMIPITEDGANAQGGHLGHVDLSNLQVARYAFSEEFICNLPSTAREVVNIAIQEGGFTDVCELESILVEEIELTCALEMSLSLLDVGSSSWLKAENTESHGGPSTQENPLDEKARMYFQVVTHSRKDCHMQIGEALLEMNQFLNKCDGLSTVHTKELESLFISMTPNEIEVVTKDLFVSMFRAVRVQQEQQMMMAEVAEKAACRFRDRASPSRSLSIPMAARIVINIITERGAPDDGSGSLSFDFDSVVKELGKYDTDASESIEEDEFVTAVNEMLRDKQVSLRNRVRERTE